MFIFLLFLTNGDINLDQEYIIIKTGAVALELTINFPPGRCLRVHFVMTYFKRTFLCYVKSTTYQS